MVGGSVPRGPIERRRRTFTAALALATVLISSVVAAGSGPAAAMVVTATQTGPTLTTTASPSVLAGGQIFDTATLSGANNPTGTITFALYGPRDPTCSSTPIYTDIQSVTGNGSVSSAPFTTTFADIYVWVATYSGDANNPPLTTACGDPAETVVVTAPNNYGISATKTATPSALPEPGGSFTVTIVVTNTSTDPVPLVVENLSDSVHGNLDGLGSCEVGASLPTIGSQYTCSFTSSFMGNAGASQTDEVVVVAKPVDGLPVLVSDAATVTITDVAPTLTVTKTATPATLPAPGGSFVFTVDVTNTSPEPVQLSRLEDDVYGDLNGQGTCATGGSPIAPGEAVTCTFPGTFTGSAGEAQTDTVTATVTDDEDNATTASAGATVALTATPATGGGDEPAARAAGPQPLRRGALARTGAALGSPAGVAGALLIAGLLLVGVGRQRRPRRRTAR